MVGSFLFNNLEYILGGVGGVSILSFYFLRKKPNHTPKNDLTARYVKYKKHSDSISKQTKSIF